MRDRRELKRRARSRGGFRTLSIVQIVHSGNETEFRVKNDKRESILPLGRRSAVPISESASAANPRARTPARPSRTAASVIIDRNRDHECDRYL